MSKTVSRFHKIVLSLFMGLAFASAAHAVPAIDWLASQQDPYGAYTTSTDIATPFQSTSETLRAFTVTGQSFQAGIPSALQFINAETFHSTEILSRKITANVQAGNDVTSLVAELLAAQNLDGAYTAQNNAGGYGELAGYDSTALDSVYALEAIYAARAGAPNEIGYLITSLISHQGVDGGFSHGSGNEVSIYLTAKASLALQKYLMTYSTGADVSAANQYLLNNLNVGGVWAGDWEIAASLLAIIPATTDSMLYIDAVNHLRSTQLPNGSWGNDVFTTALAAQAIQLADNAPIPVDPTTGLLIGKVVDQATGSPLAGVSVSIDSNPVIEAFSAADGSFELRNVTPGAFTVTYQTAGYLTATQQTSVQMGQTVNLGSAALSASPVTGIIEGTITDAQSGLPVIGAIVSASGQVFVQAVVDANGYYRLALPSGSVSIAATAPGYQSSQTTATVLVGGTLNFSPSLQPQPAPSPLSAGLRGVVVDAYSSAPLSGAMVEVGNGVVTTITDGSFTVAGLNPGQTSVRISAPGYQAASYAATLAAGSTLDMGTVGLTALPQIVIDPYTQQPNDPYVQIVGRVVDGGSGLSMPGASVQVVGTRFSGISNGSGAVAISGVVPGNLTIEVAKAGYQPVRYQVATVAGSIVDLGDVQLLPAVVEVVGTVVDSYTGLPISGVAVQVANTPYATLSLADGSIRLSGLPAGDMVIDVSMVGYNSRGFTVSAPNGGTVDLGMVSLRQILAPQPAVQVNGSIVDSYSGLPIAGATIQVLNTAISGVSGADGSFLISGDATGSLIIEISMSGYQTARYTATANTGVETIISLGQVALVADVAPPTTSTLSGIVIAGDTGLPLAGAAVQIVNAPFSGISLADGSFGVANISNGQYDMSISAVGYLTVTYTLIVSGGSFDIGQIILPVPAPPTSSVVGGKVTDVATGVPIPGATVRVDPAGISAITDSYGEYRIAGIAGNQMTVMATAVGYQVASQSIDLVRHGLYTVDIPLSAAAVSGIEIVQLDTYSGLTSFPSFTQEKLNVVIANHSSVDKQIILWVKVLDSFGIVVEDYPTVLVPLGGDPNSVAVQVPANGQVMQEAPWNSGQHPAGLYQVIVQAFDGWSMQILGERAISLNIEETIKIGGMVQFDPPLVQLAAQKPVNIKATINNRGNVDLTNVTATATVRLAGQGYQRGNQVSVKKIADNTNVHGSLGRFDTDGTGNLFVINSSARIIQKVTPDGVVTDVATGLTSPIDIDLDSAGNMYVLQNGNYVRIATDGTRTVVPTGINGIAIEALADGRVQILQAQALYEVALDGTVSQVLGQGLSSPKGATVDSQGNIFIADTGTNSIAKYALDGSLSTFVTGINQPYGIIVDAQDNLYVTSFGDNSLVKVTPAGVISTIATGLSGPYDVKILPNGDFVVSNNNSNQVVEITPGGQMSVLVDGGLARPVAVEMDANGNSYVLNQNSRDLVRIGIDDSRTILASGLSSPKDLALAADGSIYLLEDNGRTVSKVGLNGSKSILATLAFQATGIVSALDGNGAFVNYQSSIYRVDNAGQVSVYVDEMFAYPVSIKRDSNGIIYILNQSGFVNKIDPITEQIDRLVSGLVNPSAMAVDPYGNLIVVERSSRRIVKVDGTGNISTVATATIYPDMITVKPDGTILLAQNGQSIVYSIDSNGATIPYFTSSWPIYYAMGVSDIGELWLGHYYMGTSRIAADGSQTLLNTNEYTYIQGFTNDGLGGIYLCKYNSVLHLDALGVISELISPSQFFGQSLIGMTFDSASRLWTLSSQGYLSRFNPDFTFDTKFASLNYSSRMAYSGADELVVINSGNIIKLMAPNRLPTFLTSGYYSNIAGSNGANVLLASNASVSNLDTSSGIVTPIFSASSEVTDIASTTGLIAATNAYLNQLSFFDASGNLSRRIQGIESPKGLLVDQSGDILIGAYNGIYKKTANGISQFSPNTADYMAQGLDGSYWVGNGSLTNLDASGSIIRSLVVEDPTYVPSTRSTPVVGSDGLVTAISDIGWILKERLNGGLVPIAVGLSSGNDIEGNNQGDLLIADSNRNATLSVQASSLSLNHVFGTGYTPLFLGVSDSGRVDVMLSMGVMSSLMPDGQEKVTAFSPLVSGAYQGVGSLSDGSFYVASNWEIYLFASSTPPDINIGDIVYSKSIALSSLPTDFGGMNVDFGSWMPQVSGDFSVDVDFGSVPGNMFNTLHVGENAQGAVSLTHSGVLPGDQPVSAQLNVFGADSTTISQINPDSVSLMGASTIVRPHGMAADDSGNIYVLGSDDRARYVSKLVRIAADGTVGTIAQIPFSPYSLGWGLARNEQGDFFYIGQDGNVIYRIDQSGNSTLLARLNKATALAGGYDNQLYVLNNFGTTIDKVSPDGTVEQLFDLGVTDGKHLTIDAFGDFYFSVDKTSFSGFVTSYAVVYKVIRKSGQIQVFQDGLDFQFEGINITADCSNNLLFVPYSWGYRNLPTGEESEIYQKIGETGVLRKILDGPTIDPDMGDMDVLYYDRFGQRLLIWTDRNNGKVFSFPDVCGGIDVEAHMVFGNDVSFSSADPAPVSAMDLGNGTTEYTWSLPQADSRGTSVQLNLQAIGMADGETRPIARDAFLEFANTFVPGEKIRAPIDIPTITASSLMTITPALDAAQYGPQMPVNITADVLNESGAAYDGSIRLTIADSQGNPVEVLPSIPVAALTGVGPHPFTAQWNTAANIAGGYKVVAELLRVDGSVAATGEVSFSIEPGIAVLATNVSVDKQTYNAWDQVQISSRLLNQSANAILPPSDATVTLRDLFGNTLFTQTDAVGELLPNGFRELFATAQLVDAAGGDYSVTLQVYDAASGALIGSDSKPLRVVRNNGQSLTGSVTLTPSPTLDVLPTLCTANAVNRSAQSLAGVTFTQSLINADTGALIDSFIQTVDLYANGTFAHDIPVASSTFAQGGYACVLEASVGGNATNLGYAGFMVSASNTPPVADAGLNATAFVGDTVMLDGTASSDADGDPLTYLWALSVPAGSTSVLSSASAVQPTFVVDSKGVYTGTLVVNDGVDNSAPASVTVTVPNRAPAALNDAVSVDEDATVVINMLANDSDADGDPLSVTSTGSTANGSLMLNPDGTASYSPNPNFNGSDSFTYTISDGDGGSATATVNITVNPVNDAPVATTPAIVTDEDVAGSTQVSVSDPDAGDTHTFAVTAMPANGTAVVDAAGLVTYTPNLNWNGSDSLTVTVTDSAGTTGVVTIPVTVNSVNDAPLAVDDAYSADEDVALSGASVLVNDSDVDGDPLTSVMVTSPANGTLTLDPYGSFTYTPDTNWNGTDSFTYKANDGQLDSNVVTVTITVNAVNDAPVATAPAIVTDEDVAGTTQVSVTDPDSGDTHTFAITSTPANGSALIDPYGLVTYTPNTNWNGNDSLTVTVTDSGGLTATTVVPVTVNPVNDAPVAVGDGYVTDEDVALSGASVLVNDSDVDGDVLTAVLVTSTANGSLTLDPYGTFTYSPNANWNGTDSFTYKANDGVLDSGIVTVTITVNAVNDAPVATAPAIVTDEDVAGSTQVAVTDPDAGDTHTFAVTTAPANGMATVDANGLVTYTPSLNFNGSDSLTVTVTDSAGATGVVTIPITVIPVNDAPVAVGDVYATDEDVVLSGTTVLANDTDVDGDALTAVLVSPTANGSLTLNSDGTFTYSPNANWNGTDSFTYKANDGVLDSGIVTVTIVVNPVNDAPVADAGSDQIAFVDDSVLFSGIGSYDVDGDPITYSWRIIAAPAGSNAALLPADAMMSMFVPDEQGDYLFELVVNDGMINSAPAAVALHVPNRTPTAVVHAPAEAFIDDVVTLDGYASFDPDNDPLTYLWTLTTPNGSSSVLSDPYTVAPTFTVDRKGIYSATLTVTDDMGASNSAMVMITIPNRPPVADSGPDQTVYFCDLVTVDGSNSYDLDHDPITYNWSLATPANSTIGLTSNNAAVTSFIPDVAGDYLATLRVNDGTVDSVPDTAVITAVTPPVDLYATLHRGSGARMLVLMPEMRRDEHHGEHADDSEPVAPAPTAEQLLLESTLDDKGWLYTVVHSDDDFLRELRTGGYGVYGIFGTELGEEAARELNVAVYRGEGLIYASSHEADELSDALGLESEHAEQVRSADLMASDLADAQVLSFVSGVRVAPAKLESASAIATTVIASREEDGRHNDGHREHSGQRTVAVAATNGFGAGQSLYIGFDLLNEIVGGMHNGVLADLLDAGLDHVKSDIHETPGAVVPVTLDVSNIACIPAAGRVTIVLPDGVSVIDAGSGAEQSGSLVWEFNLAVNGNSSWTFWLRLPDSGGSVNLDAVIEAGYTMQQLAPFTTVHLALDVPPGTTFDGAMADAMGAAAGDRELEKQLEKVNDSWLAGRIEKAFGRLLKAFDEALGDDGRPDSPAAPPISWAERALAMILPVDSGKDDEGERHE